MTRCSPVWTLDEVEILIAALWPLLQAAGWHVGLTGGVLYRGHSYKDLDLVAFPRDSTRADRRKLRRVLRDRGWMLRHNANFVRRRWRAQGSTDAKHVEVWQDRRGRRVDLMIMGETPARRKR